MGNKISDDNHDNIGDNDIDNCLVEIIILLKIKTTTDNDYGVHYGVD